MNDVAVAEPAVCRVSPRWSALVAVINSVDRVVKATTHPHRSSTTNQNRRGQHGPFTISSHPYARPNPRLALMGETDTPGCSATPHRG
jgi:hypothetical protein